MMKVTPRHNTVILRDLGSVYFDNGESTLRLREEEYASLCLNGCTEKEHKLYDKFLTPAESQFVGAEFRAAELTLPKQGS